MGTSKKKQQKVWLVILSLALFGCTLPGKSPAPAGPSIVPNAVQRACTSFCLDNGETCLFGSNQDNSIEIGMLFVNPREFKKTTWEANTEGEYARWTSKYGSVTVNFAGYQLAWSGMNEAGLMISTMFLEGTQAPAPDERPPFVAPFWMQFVLDNYSTVEQVLASNDQIRIAPGATDHYLVCDRQAECATIELIEGRMLVNADEKLPVKALTNSPYRKSVNVWQQSLKDGNPPHDESMVRFATVASRLEAFTPSTPEEAVSYAFDTLQAASRDDTVWSLVYDPQSLRLYYTSNENPSQRYVDLAKLDLSCQAGAKMLNIHADLVWDVNSNLVPYTLTASLTHSLIFFTEYPGAHQPPFLVDALLQGLESFPCVEGNASNQGDLELYDPFIPPTVKWAGWTVWHYAWPILFLMLVLGLFLRYRKKGKISAH
jgi:penicillin V acylase-like amidase (Ntn superfamily)